MPFAGGSQDSLTQVTWKSVSSNIFETVDHPSYHFKAMSENIDFTERWGYTLTFSKDGTFQTQYSAPCGVDCFTSVSGHYMLLPDQRVEIYVKDIHRSGYCTKKSEQPGKSFGIYDYSFKDGELKLVVSE